MTSVRIEEQQSNWNTLERLAKAGPVIVTRNGIPRFVVQEATPEWVEAWAAEMEISGDMPLEDYARLYGLQINEEAYRQEYPEDAAYTYPPEVSPE
jgi:hypothetical protein